MGVSKFISIFSTSECGALASERAKRIIIINIVHINIIISMISIMIIVIIRIVIILVMFIIISSLALVSLKTSAPRPVMPLRTVEQRREALGEKREALRKKREVLQRKREALEALGKGKQRAARPNTKRTQNQPHPRA